MLEIRNLAKSFGGVKATNDVSLDFPDGSLTAVIQPISVRYTRSKKL